MKKLLCALLASPAIAFAANGAADGIYACSVRLGNQTQAAYVTVNGQLDGRTVFAVAAVSPSQSFFGYGIGSLSGSGVFAGNTSSGATFNLQVSATGMSGTVGILSGGVIVNASATCGKIW